MPPWYQNTMRRTHPDPEKVSSAMRPSKTFNNVIASLGR